MAPAYRWPAATQRVTVRSPMNAIESYLRRAERLHVYELGDLDPREAPHTAWFASDRAAFLVYNGLSTPTIAALAHGDPAALHDLLAEHAHELPSRFYAHLTPGVEAALAPTHRLEALGRHLKMALDGEPRGEPGETELLAPAHAGEALAFYRVAYPGAYFEPVNLERGPYVAIRERGAIAAIAGVHVYSPVMRVAALGNIATHPDARGRGLAGRATAALCKKLRADGIETIGLNVKLDNPAAIACYRRLGFVEVAEYDEWRVTRLVE